MKQVYKKIIQDSFLKAGFWVLLSTLFLNTGNYLYHLIMARMLGPTGYGLLESVISFSYLLFIPLIVLSTIIIKFTSDYKGKDEAHKISHFYNYIKNKTILFGLIFSAVILICSPFIIYFLKLPSVVYSLILSIIFFIGLLGSLNKSILQGVSNFFAFSISNILETGAKIIFAVALVYIGFDVEGAFAAIALSMLVGLFVTIPYIKKLQFNYKGEIAIKPILHYGFPVLLTYFALTSLYTADVLLVRFFFSPVESGFYAALSVLGRIIYFAVAPVTIVMFPFISEHHARGTDYKKFFYYSIGLTVFGVLTILIIYFLFPNFIIGLLFGKEYLAISPYVGIFGVFIALYSISALLATFYLSIHKTKMIYILMFFTLSQIILILLFHSSLYQVIASSIASISLLLASLLLYYPYATSKPKK